jgi:hypothetical protein
MGDSQLLALGLLQRAEWIFLSTSLRESCSPLLWLEEEGITPQQPASLIQPFPASALNFRNSSYRISWCSIALSWSELHFHTVFLCSSSIPLPSYQCVTTPFDEHPMVCYASYSCYLNVIECVKGLQLPFTARLVRD